MLASSVYFPFDSNFWCVICSYWLSEYIDIHYNTVFVYLITISSITVKYSTTYAVYLSDAFRPRSPVVWSSPAYHGDRHGRTMITCDAWLMIDPRSSTMCGRRAARSPLLWWWPCLSSTWNSVGVHWMTVGYVTYNFVCMIGHWAHIIQANLSLYVLPARKGKNKTAYRVEP